MVARDHFSKRTQTSTGRANAIPASPWRLNTLFNLHTWRRHHCRPAQSELHVITAPVQDSDTEMNRVVTSESRGYCNSRRQMNLWFSQHFSLGHYGRTPMCRGSGHSSSDCGTGWHLSRAPGVLKSPAWRSRKGSRHNNTHTHYMKSSCSFDGIKLLRIRRPRIWRKRKSHCGPKGAATFLMWTRECFLIKSDIKLNYDTKWDSKTVFSRNQDIVIIHESLLKED